MECLQMSSSTLPLNHPWISFLCHLCVNTWNPSHVCQKEYLFISAIDCKNINLSLPFIPHTPINPLLTLRYIPAAIANIHVPWFHHEVCLRFPFMSAADLWRMHGTLVWVHYQIMTRTSLLKFSTLSQPFLNPFIKSSILHVKEWKCYGSHILLVVHAIMKCTFQCVVCTFMCLHVCMNVK